MPFYEKGPVCIHYQEAGSGYPLLIIPGGGLNSTLSFFTGSAPFDPFEELEGEYRCIAMDLRNANGGQSSGPLEIERPWDAHADDQLGLMDHLKIDKFLVMGFCIGGPFIWNLLRRAPDRIVAAVLARQCPECACLQKGGEASPINRLPLGGEEMRQLALHCSGCRKALENAAVAWESGDLDSLRGHLKAYQDAHTHVRNRLMQLAH